MAATPPAGPDFPHDDDPFRRADSEHTPTDPVPPPPAELADEPMDLLEFADEDPAAGVPGSISGTSHPFPPVPEAEYETTELRAPEPPPAYVVDTAEPVELTDLEFLDDEPPVPAAPRSSDSDILFADPPPSGPSSNFSGSVVLPSGPASGWFDPPLHPPSTARVPADQLPPRPADVPTTEKMDSDGMAADLLFGDLEEPPAEADWRHQQASGRMTFDEPDAEAPESHVGTPASVDPPSGPSGINLLDPDADPADDTPRSSIFSSGAAEPASGGEWVEPSPTAAGWSDTGETGGSSIFGKSGEIVLPEDDSRANRATPPAVPAAPPVEAGWGQELEPADDPELAGEDVPPPLAVTPVVPVATLGDDDETPRPTAKTRRAVAATKAKAPPVEADADDKAEPYERYAAKRDRDPAKKGAGIGGLLVGTLVGVVLAGSAAAAVYLSGLVPNQPAGKPMAQVPSTVQPDGSAEKLAAANKEIDALSKEFMVAKLAADDADAKVKMADARAAKADGDLVTAKTARTKAETLLTAAQEEATKAKADLADAKTAATKAVTDLAELRTKADADSIKAKADVKAATDEGALAKIDAAKFKKTADATAAELETALAAATAANKKADKWEEQATDAAKKLKAADATLAAVVAELKANKLLDDESKLPEVIKQVAASAASSDAKKAADALLAAKKDAETARAEAMALATAAEKAKADAKDAQAAADKAKTDADKLVTAAKKDAQDRMKDAVAAAVKGTEKELEAATSAAKKAQTDADAAIKAAKADADTAAKKEIYAATTKAADAEAAKQAEVKKYEKQLADQAEKFRQQLVDARSGGGVSLTTAEIAAKDRASTAYGRGVAAYYARKYADAEPLLAAAVKDYPADARYWYFLGLAQSELDKADDAVASFKKGADLESRGKPGAKVVSDALERVQFSARKLLAEYRP